MVEFVCAVGAMNCSVEIQRELAERNAELLENPGMKFRTEIKLGDLIEEPQRIYEDWVNIPARMNRLAQPGGSVSRRRSIAKRIRSKRSISL